MFLRSVLASAGPKLLLWGPELITFHNDAYLDLLGVHGPGIGRGYRELRPDIWDKVGPHVEAALAGEARLLVDQRGITRRRGYDELMYATLCYTPVYDGGGEVVGVLGDIYDTSAVNRAHVRLLHENERLTRVFKRAPFLIAFATLPNFRFTYVNDAFSAFFGERPLLGLSVAEAIPESVDQGFVGLLEEACRTGEPWIGAGVPLVLRNPPAGVAETRHVDFIYQPLSDPDHGVTGIACFGYDATANVQAQEQARRLQAQLLHGARVNAMGTMAMTLAHELNQPLTAAANYLSIAERAAWPTESASDVPDALGLARGEILRAGEIIRRIRDMVSAGRGKAEPVRLARALDNARALLAAGSGGFALEVAADVEPGAAEVLFDPVQLEQVLVNLLRNAAEASAATGARRAELRAARRGSEVCVTLLDWGGGIDPARLPTLFEALQPLSGTGLGMGLSLCRTMIEAGGGRIRAEAAPGGGTLIAFTLPAPDAAGPAARRC